MSICKCSIQNMSFPLQIPFSAVDLMSFLHSDPWPILSKAIPQPVFKYISLGHHTVGVFPVVWVPKPLTEADILVFS